MWVGEACENSAPRAIQRGLKIISKAASHTLDEIACHTLSSVQLGGSKGKNMAEHIIGIDGKS